LLLKAAEVTAAGLHRKKRISPLITRQIEYHTFRALISSGSSSSSSLPDAEGEIVVNISESGSDADGDHPVEIRALKV